MRASGDRVVRAAQLASLALGAVDAGHSYVLPKEGSLAERVMGPSSGAWHEWGVGLLASAAPIQARAAVAPTERSMAAVALLRATVAPGHASLFVLEPATRRRSVGLFAMNVSAAVLSWRASRRLARPVNAGDTTRVAAVGLAAVDLAYGVLLARRSRLPDWLFGDSEGAWRDWGVGDLLGYTAVQAYVAARPTPAGLRAIALLRGQLVPAHLARWRLSPDRRAQSATAATANAAVAILALTAARQSSKGERRG